MKRALVTGLAMLLVACSSTPRHYSNYSNSYSTSYGNSYAPTYKASATTTYAKPVSKTSDGQNQYVKTSSVAPVPSNAPVTVSNFERLTYEDLVRFEPDCEKRVEQIA